MARLFGVYFLVKSIESLVAFIQNAIVLFRFGDSLSSGAGDSALAIASLHLAAERGMVSAAVWVFFFLLSACFFVRRSESILRFVKGGATERSE